MIFTPLTILYQNDTVFYRPAPVAGLYVVPEDETYCFYYTKTGVLRFYLDCGFIDDKLRSYNAGKDVLFALHHIKRNRRQ